MNCIINKKKILILFLSAVDKGDNQAEEVLICLFLSVRNYFMSCENSL